MQSLEQAVQARPERELEDARHDLEQALQCSDHAVRFLQTLASMHRLFSTGLGEADLSQADLSEVVRAAATVVKPQLRPGVSLEVRLPSLPAERLMCIDATRLSQVAINLSLLP